VLTPSLAGVNAAVAVRVKAELGQGFFASTRRSRDFQQWMADECNRMSAILAAVAGELAHEAGPIASEIRSLVSQMPAAPDFPAIPAFETINSSYREISMVFTEIVGHLNDLAGQGSTAADALLTEARAYINLRVQRDMAGFFAMDAGMVGRG